MGVWNERKWQHIYMLHYIYPAYLWQPEKNCRLTGMWMLLTAWKDKNFQVSKWHTGLLKNRLLIIFFVTCIWLWHLYQTIPWDPFGIPWYTCPLSSLWQLVVWECDIWLRNFLHVTKYELCQNISPMVLIHGNFGRIIWSCLL